MKANIWEHESLGTIINFDLRITSYISCESFANEIIDVGKTMDQSLSEVQKTLEPHLSQFGQRQDNSSGNNIFDTLDSDRFAERKTARA